MKRIIRLTLVLLCPLLAACSTTSSISADGQIRDPLEGYNRAMFSFNDGLDRFILKPVSQGYRFVTPDFVEQRISNIFFNLFEVRSVFNGVLQGKGKKSANYTGRFLVNSTLGLVGMFDVAKYLGMPKDDPEDFGQTLASWGVKSGPYVVLPFLGSSTLRSTSGLPIDSALDPTNYIQHSRSYYSTKAVQLIDTRAGFLEAEKLLTGDRYIFVRDAYLQRRQYLVKDGVVQDSFGEGLLDGEFGPVD